MHPSIRRYEGLISDRIEELAKLVEEGFVPILSASEGLSALLLKACHSFQYPLEGCKKQEIWRVI